MTIYTFYKLVCNDVKVTQIYVGSTKDLNDRIIKHKYCCNNPNSEGYNFKVYKFIRDNGGWFNWKFKIIDSRECIDEYESYVIEQSYINSLKSELNTKSPYTGLTKNEYEIKYKQDHKEKNKEYKKQYHKKNKIKIAEISKQYYQNNTENIKEKTKQWYYSNKEKLTEKYCCLLCQGSYTYRAVSTHEKTLKHLSKLAQLNN